MPGNGGERAYAEFSRHRSKLVRWLRGMLGRKDLAEDVAQETLIKFIKEYGDGSKCCSWPLLWTIANRTAIDRLRYEDVRNGSAIDLEPRETEVEPIVEAMRAERQETIRRAIDRLQPNQRQIFVLRFLKEMTLREIAEILGISLGAAQQRLHRSVKAFRKDPLMQDLARAQSD